MTKWAEGVEKKTGIPREYLNGKERIRLGREFEKTVYPKYKDYIASCDDINEILEKEQRRRKRVDYSKSKIKTISEGNSIDEIVNSPEVISKAKDALEIVAGFDLGLSQEIDRIKTMDTSKWIQENKKFYQLLYFIKYGRKHDAIDVITLTDVMAVAKRTKGVEFMELGEQGLQGYIKVMESHLNLAKSVYTVAVDEGRFQVNAPTKQDKKIY